MTKRAFFCLIALAAAPALAQTAADLPEGCNAEAAQAAKPLPFGCANALNLRAMLADQADLGAVGAAPPPQGEPALQAIGRHRDGSVQPLPGASSTEAPGDPGAR